MNKSKAAKAKPKREKDARRKLPVFLDIRPQYDTPEIVKTKKRLVKILDSFELGPSYPLALRSVVVTTMASGVIAMRLTIKATNAKKPHELIDVTREIAFFGFDRAFVRHSIFLALVDMAMHEAHESIFVSGKLYARPHK